MNENQSSEVDAFAARDALVLANLGIARRAAFWAQQRMPPSVEYDDLFQSATIGLLEAAALFDESRGVPFEAFAHKRVFGAAVDPFRGSRYRDQVALPLDTANFSVKPSSDALIAARQLSDLIALVLPVLGQTARAVIRCHYWRGIPLAQIAGYFRFSLGQTYGLHRHALEELKRELRRHFSVQELGNAGQRLL
jgi:RNA polymerase sigma factor (sigma-70 family)